MARTTPKEPVTRKGRARPFKDILEVARVLSSSTVPERVIEAVLTHLCERLGKRARCAMVEGEDLRLRFWAGEHTCAVNGLKINENSVVWDAVRKGRPVNLTERRQTNGFGHTLAEPIRIKSVIPLSYVDPLTERREQLGALIVDSGIKEQPISGEDFEYLQLIGELISAIIGRARLIEQLMQSCHRQETILLETAHRFRNSIAVIGGFSQRIAKVADDRDLAENAKHLFEEVKTLEAHLAVFEKYMSLKPETGNRITENGKKAGRSA
jgi:hypothetical protein